MGHRLFNLIVALSMLLCVAMLALGVRSYWREEVLTYDAAANGCYDISSSGGRIIIGWCNLNSSTGWSSIPIQYRDPGALWHFGFRWNILVESSYVGDFRESDLNFPHWALAFVAAIAPAVWLGRRIRRESRIAGKICLSCGYDLRASRERCPECGTPFQAAAS